MRDEIVDLVTVKKQGITLNFLIGALNVNHHSYVQFKSLSVEQVVKQQ